MKRKYTGEEEDTVLSMLDSQHSIRQVSTATGVPASTIGTWLHRKKVKVTAPNTLVRDAADTDLMLDISNSLTTVCHLAKECLQWRSKALVWSAKLVELQNILSSSETTNGSS